MVINATNNTLAGLNSLIHDNNIKLTIKRVKKAPKKIIKFPNRKILEQDIKRANCESLNADKITADFTSQMYLHLLLVAGSRTLHRTRLLSSHS